MYVRKALGILFIPLILGPSIVQAQGGVGVKPGDWAIWELSAHSINVWDYFSSSEPTVEDISNRTYEMRFLAVSGDNVTWMHNYLIPLPIQNVTTNVLSSSPMSYFNLMPADLKVGDRVQRVPFWYPVTQAGIRMDKVVFNATVIGSEDRVVLGSVRRLNRVHFEYRNDSSYGQPEGESLRRRLIVDVLFDAETGLLVESYFSMWTAIINPSRLAQVLLADSSRYVLRDTNAWREEAPINPIVYSILFLLVGASIPTILIFLRYIKPRREPTPVK